jgi:hypothetical protein
MRGGEDGDCCEPSRPWVLMVGGPATSEEDLGLAFTPAFPCGVEISAPGGETRPLRVIARWGGCIGDPNAGAGARALVTGSVASITTTRTGVITWRAIGECEGETTQPRLKLKIKACGIPEPIIIDADSSIVVPAGPAVIELIGPSTWTLQGSQTVDQQLWTDTTVRVSACPLTWIRTVERESFQQLEDGRTIRCVEQIPVGLDSPWAPPGVLTEWWPIDPAGTAESRILLRPRRARRLLVSSSGIDAVTVQMLHANAAAPVFGAANFPALGQLLIDPFGAASHVGLQSVSATTIYLRWGIE